MKLTLVRHGQTEENASGIIQGQSRGTLSEKGKLQAAELGETLKNHSFDVIISSSSNRAKNTASVIHAHHSSVVLGLSDAIRERKLGVEEGRPVGTAHGLMKETPEGGESLDEVRLRAEGFARELLAQDHSSCLIVSHNGFLAHLMGFFQAKPIDACLDFKIEHGEVVEINISLVDVGNLNYVYKITVDGVTGYLKQALPGYRKSFPGEKELPLKDDRLANEVAALQKLNALDVEGFTYPSVLSYDADHNLVLLSEITGKTLLSYFSEGVFDTAHASAAGDALGELHAATRDADSIRKDDDAFFKEIVRFRSVVSSHGLSSDDQKLIAERFERVFADGFPKSLLIGDFSPKQLLLSEGSVGVVDLEFACCGDRAFDVGFFLAHYVLEEMKGADADAVKGSIDAFLEAYGKHIEVDGMKSRILFYMGAGLLNRVDGTVRGGDINDVLVDAIRERSIKIITEDVTYGMG